MQRTVTVGFSRPRKFRLGSFLIRCWQNCSSFSHVYLKSEVRPADRVLVYQASHGEVHAIEFNNFKADNVICSEVEITLDEKQYWASIRVALDLLQRPYGFIGLARLVMQKLTGFRLVGDGRRSLHCSEFVAVMLPDLAARCEVRDADFMEPIHIHKALQEYPGAVWTIRE